MSLAEAIADGSYGIWVVGNQFNNTATVYVGTKLEQTNTITVTPAKDVADGALIPDADDPDGQNYTYTINDKNDDGKLDLVVKMDATSQYATMVVTETTKGASTVISPNTDGTVTLPNVAKGDTYKVTVTTECNGQCAEPARAEWTITIDGWNIISKAVDRVAGTGGTHNTLEQDLDVYYSYTDAVNRPVELSIANFDWVRFYGDNDLVITNDSSNGWFVKYMTFSTTAQALDEDNYENEAKVMSNNVDNTVRYNSIQTTELEDNHIVVLSYTPQNEGNERVYVAFQIEK